MRKLFLFIVFTAFLCAFAPARGDESTRVCAEHLQAPAAADPATDKNVFDSLFDSIRVPVDPYSIFHAADINPEYRARIMTVLQKRPFARTASAEGLRFRSDFLSFLRDYDSTVPLEILIRPINYINQSYSRVKYQNTSRRERPLKPHEAINIAFSETRSYYDLAVERPEDLEIGSAAYLYFKQRLARHSNSESPRLEKTQTNVATLRRWISELDDNIGQLIFLNTKAALQDAVENFGDTYLQMVRFAPSDSHRTIRLTPENIASSTRRIQPSPGRISAIVRHPTFLENPFHWAGGKLSILKQEILARVNLLWFDRGETLVGRYPIPNTQYLTCLNFESEAPEPLFTTSNDVFPFIAENVSRLPSFGSANRALIRNRLRNYIHVHHRLETIREKLWRLKSALYSNAPIKNFEQTLLAERQTESQNLENLKKTRFTSDKDDGMLGKLSPEQISGPGDFITGLEWYGYMIEPSYWLKRSESHLLNQYNSNSKTVRGLQNFIGGIANSFSRARMVSWYSGFILTLLGISGLPHASTGVLHGDIPGIDLPAITTPQFASGLSNLALGEATNDSSDDTQNQTVIANLYALGEDIRPLYFDYPTTQEMREGSWRIHSPEPGPPVLEPGSVILRTQVPIRLEQTAQPTRQGVWSSGTVFLPVPAGYYVKRAWVAETPNHQDGRALPPDRFAIMFNSLNGHHYLVVNSESQDIASTAFSYEVQLERSTDTEWPTESPHFTNLDASRIEALAEELDAVGFASLATGLKAMVRIRQAQHQPINLQDIETVFSTTEVYTHERESFLNLSQWFDDRRFAFYRRFLAGRGTLYYECDGGNSLMADFLRAYYENNPRIVIENRAAFVARYADEPQSNQSITGNLTLQRGHLRTRVHDLDRNAALILDGTPTRRGDRPVPTPIGNPTRTVALPTTDPRNRARRSFVVVEPLTPQQRASQQHFHDTRLRALQNAHRALISLRAFEELGHATGDRKTTPFRVLRLASLLIEYAGGHYTAEALQQGLAGLYPMIVNSPIESTSDLRRVLSEINRSERHMWERYRLLAAKNERLAALLDPVLQENVFTLLNVITTHHWQSTEEPQSD